MADSTISAAMRVAAGDDKALQGGLRYDGVAMTLHWITAVLVVVLFSLAHIWSFLPRGPVEVSLQTAHVSLGVVLAVVLVVRIVWRAALGRRIPPAATGLVEQAARGMHYLLYALLIAMVVAGFGKRWVRHHGVEFFGLSIPAPFALDPSWRSGFNAVHHWGAWAVIIFAGLHALAALFHRFVLRDGVLARMLPGRRRVGAH